MDIGSLWQGAINLVANGLVVVYNALSTVGIPSWGLTIILFTLIIKVILLPLTVQQLRSARAMQVIQPAMRELQKKYGKDREKLAQEQMKLYKEHGVNPLGGCLPLLVQLPIWFALYNALSTLANPGSAISMANNVVLGGFLWIPDLNQPDPLRILAILSGISQWVMTRQTTPKSNDQQQQQMNNAMQLMPLMFVFIAFNISSGLVLYWVANALISIVLQYPFIGWGSLEGFNFFGLLKRESSSAGNGAKVVKATSTTKELVDSGASGTGDDTDPDGQEQSSVTRKRRSRRR